MSQVIRVAHLNARRNVLLSLIGELICDDKSYQKEMEELHKIDDLIAKEK